MVFPPLPARLGCEKLERLGVWRIDVQPRFQPDCLPEAGASAPSRIADRRQTQTLDIGDVDQAFLILERHLDPARFPEQFVVAEDLKDNRPLRPISGGVVQPHGRAKGAVECVEVILDRRLGVQKNPVRRVQACKANRSHGTLPMLADFLPAGANVFLLQIGEPLRRCRIFRGHLCLSGPSDSVTVVGEARDDAGTRQC